MGLDINGTRFLLTANQSGADFSRFAMIGRQKMHLMPNDLKQLMDAFGHNLELEAINQLLNEDERFAEPFIKAIGGDTVVSLDASPEILKKRVELVNSTPAYILVQAVKLQNKNIFEVMPQQSDYTTQWEQS